MLKLKHKHHLDFPHLTFSTPEMSFSPIPSDDDELTQAIEADAADTWELSERPDMGELSEFWSEVEADISTDPEWIKLSAE